MRERRPDSRTRIPWVRILWSLVFAFTFGIYATRGQWGWASVCLVAVALLFGSAWLQHRWRP